MLKTKNQEHRPIMIIDGMNLFIRNFMVNETITAQGIPVGGVVGFIRSLNALVRDMIPSKVFIAWESGGGSQRRKKIFEGYKANREKDKKTFKEIKKEDNRKWIQKDADNKEQQLNILINVLKHIPVCQLYVQDVEGDDVIGYLTKYKFKNTSGKKIIVSSDKDFYQLLDDKQVEIFEPTKKIIVNEQAVLEMFDISPNNFALAKSVVGDESDNINGVGGVGFKTLTKRIPGFNEITTDYCVGDLIEYCEQMVTQGTKIKVYKDIIDARMIVERNWKLMYLSSNSMSTSQIQKIEYAVDTFEPKMDKLGLIKGLISNQIITDIDFDKLASTMKMTLCCN